MQRPIAAPPIRVLVVDDAVVVRRVVGRAIERDPSLALVGVAANGKLALAKIEALRPDVVVLDLEMPVMDGLETLAAIRRTNPALPVIVFSHLTAPSADATLDALAAGASDFAMKPRADGIGLAEDQVVAELLPRIKALVRPSMGPTPKAAPRVRAAGARAVDVVVMAASTGGPNALAEILPAVGGPLRVPILVVQHMPPVFTMILAQRLDRAAAVPVAEAQPGEPVVPGRVYLAPGGHHLAVVRSGDRVRIRIYDGPPENSCRPAADVLFRSAAAAYGAGVLGVVLTGMGHDGLRGAEAVRAAGGTVIAQDEQTSVVASMPAAVAAAGLTDTVHPVGAIGPELARRISGKVTR